MSALEPYDYLIDEPEDLSDEYEPMTAEEWAADLADRRYHEMVENGYEEER